MLGALSETIDGSEHANYINERLNSPGFTIDDMDKLRDEPTVLHHIKALYQVIMHNRGCFIDEELRELGFEELSFPRGRIKLFKTEDHTFSFTELSEYGLNAKSFSELYASIGVFYGLSIQDAAERMKFKAVTRLDIDSLLFPSVVVAVKTFCSDDDLDYDSPLFMYANTKYVEEIFKITTVLSGVKGGYDINDLIRGTKTQAKVRTQFEKWSDMLVLNYSFIYYDDSWFDNDYLSHTEEAVKALTFIALERDLISGKGFIVWRSCDQQLEQYRIDHDSGSLYQTRIKTPIPGTLVTIDTTDYNQLDRHFNKITDLELLPEVSVSIKQTLSAFFKVEFGAQDPYSFGKINIINGCYFCEPTIWDTTVRYCLKKDWKQEMVIVRD